MQLVIQQPPLIALFINFTDWFGIHAHVSANSTLVDSSQGQDTSLASIHACTSVVMS